MKTEINITKDTITIKEYKLAVLIPEHKIENELKKIVYMANKTFPFASCVKELTEKLEEFKDIYDKCNTYFNNINQENSNEILKFMDNINSILKTLLGDIFHYDTAKPRSILLKDMGEIMRSFSYFPKYKESFNALQVYILEKYGNEYKSLFDEREKIIQLLNYVCGFYNSEDDIDCNSEDDIDCNSEDDNDYNSEDDNDYDNILEHLYGNNALKHLPELVSEFFEFEEFSLKLYSALPISKEDKKLEIKQNELEYYMEKDHKLDKLIMQHNIVAASIARSTIKNTQRKIQKIRAKYLICIDNHNKLLLGISNLITSFKEVFDVKNVFRDWKVMNTLSNYNANAIRELVTNAPESTRNDISETIELADEILEMTLNTDSDAPDTDED